jgi:hypothetical protein
VAVAEADSEEDEAVLVDEVATHQEEDIAGVTGAVDVVSVHISRRPTMEEVIYDRFYFQLDGGNLSSATAVGDDCNIETSKGHKRMKSKQNKTKKSKGRLIGSVRSLAVSFLVESQDIL